MIRVRSGARFGVLTAKAAVATRYLVSARVDPVYFRSLQERFDGSKAAHPMMDGCRESSVTSAVGFVRFGAGLKEGRDRVSRAYFACAI